MARGQSRLHVRPIALLEGMIVMGVASKLLVSRRCAGCEIRGARLAVMSVRTQFGGLSTSSLCTHYRIAI